LTFEEASMPEYILSEVRTYKRHGVIYVWFREMMWVS
jgi:hypothetical protein